MRQVSAILSGLRPILAACCSAAVLTGCTRDLELPAIPAKPQIVLLGELTAGDSVYLRAGQSLPVAAGSGLQLQLVQGLQLSLQESGGANLQLHGREDALSPSLLTIPYTTSHQVKAGTVYDLTAAHASLGTATAHVTIPQAISAFVTDTGNLTYAGGAAMKVDIRIQDAPGVKQYYVIEVLKQQLDVGSFLFQGEWYSIRQYRSRYDSLKYIAQVPPLIRMDTTYRPVYTRQQVYTADPNAENLSFSNVQQPAKRILFRDDAFDGQPYSTTLYISRQGFVAAEEENKGRILVLVKSVSEDYFRYLRQYEQASLLYDPDQPVQVTGNVVNGYGVVGGVYRQQFAYLFDTWVF